ncbi:MAG: DUF4013 domain-containing protein [Candidatus Aenigmatarchaeota archaeon]
MRYGDAIKRPFQDLKTFIIGVIVMIIPVVNFTIGTGYLLVCARTAMRRDFKLPKWKDWGDLFIKGLIAFIITILYFIPTIVLFFLTIGTSLFAGLTGTQTAIDILLMLSTAGIGVVLTAIVFLITIYIVPLAVVRYAEKDNFESAFELNFLTKKAFTGRYFVAWFVAMLYSFIIIAILSFIPLIGPAIGSFLGYVTCYTIIAEAYSK